MLNLEVYEFTERIKYIHSFDIYKEYKNGFIPLLKNN